MRVRRFALLALFAVAAPFAALACGNTKPADSATPTAMPASASASASSDVTNGEADDCNDSRYVAAPAWSGKEATIPDPPVLPNTPRKTGDSFTVSGAAHALHARSGGEDLAHEISVVGYIVASNFASAPLCALHRVGHRDPDGCIAPIPSFTIADAKDTTKSAASTDDTPPPATIRVMGFAANFARVYEAAQRYKGLTKPPAQLYTDEIWAVEVPYPLPALGAKVKVYGRYATTFTRSSTGMVTDAINGILTFTRMDVIEPAPKPAHLGP